MHVKGDYNTFTNDELYDKYLEYLKSQQCEEEEEDIVNFFDEDVEEEEDSQDFFDEDDDKDDFKETIWEEADSEEMSFEDWKDMCGYYELGDGLYTNV